MSNMLRTLTKPKKVSNVILKYGKFEQTVINCRNKGRATRPSLSESVSCGLFDLDAESCCFRR